MVWPFKKTLPRIRDSWLADHSISNRWSDAFNRSKRQLRTDIQEQTAQIQVFEAKLKELESSKIQIDANMLQYRELANDPDASEQIRRDNAAKLRLEEGKFTQDVNNSLTFVKKIKEASNTRWLLENILSGTFRDPLRMSDPPVFEPKSWSQIFAELPESDDLDEDYLNEMYDYYGIDRKVAEQVINEVEDDVDPLI